MPRELVDILFLKGVELQGGKIRGEWKEQFNSNIKNHSKGQDQIQTGQFEKHLCSAIPEVAVNSNRAALVGDEGSESASRALKKWNFRESVDDLCGW